MLTDFFAIREIFYFSLKSGAIWLELSYKYVKGPEKELRVAEGEGFPQNRLGKDEPKGQQAHIILSQAIKA